MVQYFRINDPYRLLGLLVILTLLYLPLLIDTPGTLLPEVNSFVLGEKVNEGFHLYSEIIDSTPPFTAWFYGLMDLLLGRSLTGRHIVTFLILFIQSAFLGIIFIDKKVFSENTYLPSFLFSILAFLSFDFLSLTSDLLAFGFILLALNNLFKEIEFRVQREETIFNLGLFISFASLFNFSYSIYLPGLIIILLIFTRNSFRKYLLLLYGFLLPNVLLVGYYYYTDNLKALWEVFYLPNLAFSTGALISTPSLLWLCAIPLFYLFLSLFILNRDAHLTKYQSQIFQAMFLWFVLACIQLLFIDDLRPQSLLPLLPPVAFFFTHFMLLIRRRKFAEMNLWVLLLGIVSVSYLARYHVIPSIQYDQLVLKKPNSSLVQSRILVLDHQPGLFLENHLAAPFCDWQLAQSVFEDSDDVENVLLVSRLMEKDLPQVIVDPHDRMAGFFQRIPTLAVKYKKSPEGYRLLSINN